MPINENEEWPNGHTIYLATSGAGKGSMLRGNPDIPKPSQGGRIVVWDRAKAFPAHYYKTRNSFVKALESAVNSGKGFACGYTGGDASNIVAEHDWWARLVWHVLDGRYQTHIVDEEISETSKTAGKAEHYGALLANQSRKYGGVWHGSAQRPTEVPKTFTDNADVRYIGRQVPRAARRMADLIGISDHKELIGLQDGEFLRESRGVIERGRYAKVNIKRRELAGGIIKTT
jgi:hypothetical protein